MLFTTPLFWLFFLCVYVVWRVLRSGRRNWLLAASWLFYASWAPPNGLFLLPLLITSGLVDYAAGGQLYAGRGPRGFWLCLSVFVNLGILIVFKYLGFFNLLLGAPFSIPQLVLPLGISFYTFQSMSYTIDAYRGTGSAYRSVRDFLLFVSFFPQLVAGPIVRAESFRASLHAPASPCLDPGIRLATLGLVVKIYADNLGVPVDALFAYPELLTTADAVAATVGFGAQIYCDFAGYSLIAIGLARVFGIRLPNNFDRPYLASGPRDFWRRWHITLSQWLRDYLYIPLGGSRNGHFRTLFAIVTTMGLGGLWHGASGRFVLWGLGHAGLLLAERAFADRIPARVLQLLTLIAVFLLWVPFRAETLIDARQVLQHFIIGGWGTHAEALVVILWVLPFVAYHVFAPSKTIEEYTLELTPSSAAMFLAFGWAFCAAFSVGAVNFVYFQF